ncbi:hypothetical protein KM043_018349 [Ampulex compressa]|nr:hypothetical protein KM043_018349 [Ampulex compressa]
MDRHPSLLLLALASYLGRAAFSPHYNVTQDFRIPTREVQRAREASGKNLGGGQEKTSRFFDDAESQGKGRVGRDSRQFTGKLSQTSTRIRAAGWRSEAEWVDF